MRRVMSWWVGAAALACAATLTACSAPSPEPQRPTTARPPSPSSTPTRSPSASPTATGSVPPTATATTPASADARIVAVGPAQWARMTAAGMARAGCPVTRTDLRRVEVNHWGFDGEVHRGVLVVNRDVAASVARIFTDLFDQRFPIRRMRPLEEYGGDNEASMAADNTAAYNCRSAAQQNASPATSPHANGRAIDVNPLENPWQDPRCAPCWSPRATQHGTDRTGRGVIVEGDGVWTAFTREGWIWQDISVKDYMHFDTGYPSKPYAGPPAG